MRRLCGEQWWKGDEWICFSSCGATDGGRATTDGMENGGGGVTCMNDRQTATTDGWTETSQ